MTQGDWIDVAIKATVPTLTALALVVRYAFWAHGRLKSVRRMEKAIPWLVQQLRKVADSARKACQASNLRHDQLNLITDMLYDAETGEKGRRHQGTLEVRDREAVESLRALLRAGRRPGA